MASPSDYNLLRASSLTERPASLRSFVLHAKPGTDLWRKPSIPPVESDNAPSLVTSVPLHAFRSAQITVSAKWTRLYDQGGLILTTPTPEGDGKPAWVKTGIEFYNHQANLSTVATPSKSTSDWSLLPLTDNQSVTVRVEREVSKGELSPTLWVYLVKEDGNTVAVREITWVCWSHLLAAESVILTV